MEIEKKVPWHDNDLFPTVSDCPTDGLIPRIGWDDFFWQLF